MIIEHLHRLVAAVGAEFAGWSWLSLGLAFLLGGLVKGTLGIGLPLVAVPLVSLTQPATRAVVLMIMPVLVTNLWQARDSRAVLAHTRRFMPLIAALMLCTWLTVRLTLDLPEATLRAMVAGMVVLALVLMVLPLKLRVPPAQERWWSVLVGVLSGAMGGVSSLTGPVIVSYLMALGLTREVFVGCVSVIYLAGALPLYGAMAVGGRVGAIDLLVSTAALLPAGLGLLLGKRLRGHLSEIWFRRVLVAFLAAVAVALWLK